MGSMKSIPASSAMVARRTLSSHEPDQRSGALVTNLPDEQFEPKNPSFSLLLLPIETRADVRSCGSVRVLCLMLLESYPASDCTTSDGDGEPIERGTVVPQDLALVLVR